jgi:hypothetical protein
LEEVGRGRNVVGKWANYVEDEEWWGSEGMGRCRNWWQEVGSEKKV